MVNRKDINEHDMTWHMFNEIEELKTGIKLSENIKSRFTIAAQNKLKIKEKKLNRYLTTPASSKAYKWKSLIINEYRRKSLKQKENSTKLINDLMKNASDVLGVAFPVEVQEVRRFLASQGIQLKRINT